jgi:hypothetical protein
MSEVGGSNATGSGSTATGTAGTADPSTTEQAKDKVQQAAGQAQEKAQQAAGQAKGRLASEVDGRSTQAGEQLRSTAGDVRSVAEELRKQGKDKPAELADRAAERAERVGSYLRDSDGDRILRDIEDFGRSKPWAVALGGLVVGFAASRFLKASSSRRYQEWSYDGPSRTAIDRTPALPAGATAPPPPPPEPSTVPPRPTDRGVA